MYLELLLLCQLTHIRYFSVLFSLKYKILDVMTRSSERLCTFVYKFLVSNLHGTSVLKLGKSQANHGVGYLKCLEESLERKKTLKNYQWNGCIKCN